MGIHINIEGINIIAFGLEVANESNGLLYIYLLITFIYINQYGF